MKEKIMCVLIGTLLIITILPITAIAGDEENPEIEDETGEFWRFFPGFDIISAWFFNDGVNLYVSIKVANIQFRQFFAYTVLWRYKDTEYFASMQGAYFYFGEDTDGWLPWIYKDATGSLDEEKGIITITMPLSEIGNPGEGEKLTNTWAMTHWSGFLGLNFHFPLDRAPRWETSGKDYVI